MENLSEYELKPKNQKSFYGKANVRTEGNKIILKSYETDVSYIDTNTQKAFVLGDYSRTTLNHIQEFLKQNGFKAETPTQILKDYSVKNAEIQNVFKRNNKKINPYTDFNGVEKQQNKNPQIIQGLTSECWSIQIKGVSECKTCPHLNKKSCGGKAILKKLLGRGD